MIDIDACRTILVVSPHLDDGVLSVGGLIERAAANGADVIVATVFTADSPQGGALSPLAQELHGMWNLGTNPYAPRRDEDEIAVTSLGARPVFGGLLDALYRTSHDGAPLYPTRQSVFAAPHVDDPIGAPLLQLLQGWVTDFAPDLVLGPLGVGGHIDHAVTTRALYRLAAQCPIQLGLYEDMPYATGLFPPNAPDTVAAALRRSPFAPKGSSLIAVDLPGKLGAIAAYASQIADIFPNGLAFGSVIDNYMRSHTEDGVYSERLWDGAARA